MLEKIKSLANNNPREYWKLENDIKKNETMTKYPSLGGLNTMKNWNENANFHLEESNTKPKLMRKKKMGIIKKLFFSQPISAEGSHVQDKQDVLKIKKMLHYPIKYLNYQ